MTETIKTTLISLIDNFSYYLVDEARKSTGKDVRNISIKDVEYVKRRGRFGEVYVVDVFYSSEFADNHKSKLAIKFVENIDEAITEMKNTALLEKKFSTRSIVRVPRYIYVNLQKPTFIAYEGITGLNYDEIDMIPDKSFWAGYVLAIIHGGSPRKVIYDVYEEMFRRLILNVFKGSDKEQEIMLKSRNLLDMVKMSSGGCDAFGDFHQSNLMIRLTSVGDIVSISLIDPTFYMQGSFDRFEDVGTFFGRQILIEYRETENEQFPNTMKDIHQFLQGYDIHLREINTPPLAEIYPKGFPLDLFIGFWALMDYIDKITTQNIPPDHIDLHLLKELAYIFLTKHPFKQSCTNNR